MEPYIPKIRSIYKAKPKQGVYRHCNVCFILVKITIIKIKNNKSEKKHHTYTIFSLTFALPQKAWQAVDSHREL